MAKSASEYWKQRKEHDKRIAELRKQAGLPVKPEIVKHVCTESCGIQCTHGDF